MQQTTITKNDILPLEEFAKVRSERRQHIIDVKRNRRIALGADVTFYFENYETLLWQIQEMLMIEKGGDEQLKDELAAYNPLVPKGHELVSTVMIEIEDPKRRSVVLSQLGHFENHLVMRFQEHVIHGKPETDVDRTNEEGKTSSVHFIRWPMTSEQIWAFSRSGCDVIIECTHPHYLYKTIIPEAVRQEISGDLSSKF